MNEIDINPPRILWEIENKHHIPKSLFPHSFALSRGPNNYFIVECREIEETQSSGQRP